MIRARYLVSQVEGDPAALAEAIAREQSLELTRALIPQAIADRWLGQVVRITEQGAACHVVDIDYPTGLASGQLGQLFHLLYGNVSYYPRVRLIDFELPAELLDAFAGPLGGLAAIRRLVDAPSRPLLMAVLKPRGSSSDTLADLAFRFASGGGDLIKDDQNLVETSLAIFQERITKCLKAIENAQDKIGKPCAYWPHVAGSGPCLERQLESVARLGLPGVVMCPWVMGLETAAAAARRHGLMWLAHPASGGSFTRPLDHGIAAPVLLGKLTRLAGADIAIVPGAGGRIVPGDPEEERLTVAALRRPWGRLPATLPALGGGQRLELAAQAGYRHGADIAVVIGGELIARGDGLERAVAATIETLSLQ